MEVEDDQQEKTQLDIMEPADSQAPIQEGQATSPAKVPRGKEVTPKKAGKKGLEEPDVTKARSPTKSAKAIRKVGNKRPRPKSAEDSGDDALENLPPEIQKQVRAHAQQLLENMNAVADPATDAKR